MRLSYPQRQHGITLIESLIAIVIAGLGILGIVGVQMRTLSDTQTTVRRAQAIRLIEDLSERMKINPNAQATLSSYVSGFSDEPTPDNCASSSAGCTQAQQATYDLAIWKQNVKTLPLGQAKIFVPPAESAVDAAGRRQLGVIIAWRENERDNSTGYKNDIDATKVRNASGNLQDGAGTANACPSDRTCHLQYIPVSARCAPYQPGTGAAKYFCPGP
jgi:type IV pilus assembly protein PilV